MLSIFNTMNDLHSFLYPHASDRNDFTPENLVFNANSQEFSQRINYIFYLQTSGKMSTNESFEQIRSLWHQLDRSPEQLKIAKS